MCAGMRSRWACVLWVCCASDVGVAVEGFVRRRPGLACGMLRSFSCDSCHARAASLGELVGALLLGVVRAVLVLGDARVKHLPDGAWVSGTGGSGAHDVRRRLCR